MCSEWRHRDKYTTEIRTSDGTAREMRRDNEMEREKEELFFNQDIRNDDPHIRFSGLIINYSIHCQLITFVTS